MAARLRAESFVRSQLIEAALKHDERGFLLLHGNALVLVIVVPPGDAAFEQDLGAADASSSALAFRTQSIGPPAFARHARTVAPAGQDEASLLQGLLQEARGFALPLVKRLTADALYPDRISVGRARNKDIVLRHASVSKFHAWFETDSSDELYVADAESRNSTRLNDRALAPREKTLVRSGDRVRFGGVESIICEPAIVWAVVRSVPRS